MVKDYKHIHPVDWDEDLDDSDGGYSDFKLSDEEIDPEILAQRKMDMSYTPYTQLGIQSELVDHQIYFTPGVYLIGEGFQHPNPFLLRAIAVTLILFI